MRVAYVITEVDFYEDAGYAATLAAALEAEGVEVERLARVPAGWTGGGPPAGRYDLALAHVLVEEVVAFDETMRVATLLEASGVPLVKPARGARRLLRQAPHPRGVGRGRAAAAAHVAPRRRRHLARAGPTAGPEARARRRRTLHLARQHPRGGARGRGHLARRRGGRRAPPGRGRAAGGGRGADGPAGLRHPDPHLARAPEAREPGDIVSHGTVYARSYEPSPELAELTQRMVATLAAG